MSPRVQQPTATQNTVWKGELLVPSGDREVNGTRHWAMSAYYWGVNNMLLNDEKFYSNRKSKTYLWHVVYELDWSRLFTTRFCPVSNTQLLDCFSAIQAPLWTSSFNRLPVLTNFTTRKIIRHVKLESTACRVKKSAKFEMTSCSSDSNSFVKGGVGNINQMFQGWPWGLFDLLISVMGQQAKVLKFKTSVWRTFFCYKICFVLSFIYAVQQRQHFNSWHTSPL